MLGKGFIAITLCGIMSTCYAYEINMCAIKNLVHANCNHTWVGGNGFFKLAAPYDISCGSVPRNAEITVISTISGVMKTDKARADTILFPYFDSTTNRCTFKTKSDN